MRNNMKLRDLLAELKDYGKEEFMGSFEAIASQSVLENWRGVKT
jgi:hypothetical protein